MPLIGMLMTGIFAPGTMAFFTMGVIFWMNASVLIERWHLGSS